jgi:Peptidase_C39 like family
MAERRSFIVMPRFVLGIVLLFAAINFDAVVHAEANGAIPSTGGEYFNRHVEIPVPAFAQDDPRWSSVRLGPSRDTLGDEGCAVTSAAMVVAFYGIKTDPLELNNFLTKAGGFSDDGLIHWSRVPAIAPSHLELAYNGYASYDLIDSNLLTKNPVIAIIRLRDDGAYHFVVIVGKEGRNYLIRDPAASVSRRPYPLSKLTDRIDGICIFRTI